MNLKLVLKNLAFIHSVIMFNKLNEQHLIKEVYKYQDLILMFK